MPIIWFTISSKGYVMFVLLGIFFSLELRTAITLMSYSLIYGDTNLGLFLGVVSSFFVVKTESLRPPIFELRWDSLMWDFFFLIMSVIASDSCDNASYVLRPSEGEWSAYVYSSCLAIILFFSLMSGTSFLKGTKVAWLTLKLVSVIGSLGSSFF